MPKHLTFGFHLLVTRGGPVAFAGVGGWVGRRRTPLTSSPLPGERVTGRWPSTGDGRRHLRMRREHW
jgi:hypothetical protein